MLTNELRKAIDEYIKLNYEPQEQIGAAYYFEDSLLKDIDDKEFLPLSLKKLMEEIGQSFHEMLFKKIDESGMSDVDIYKKANIDRRLFSKIRSNPAYHPRKQTVLALAIALELNIDDATAFLASAEYAFSPGNKGDLIVKYFIEQGVYDITTINFALYEYNQNLLE